MEREVILAIKPTNNKSEKIENEIKNIKRIFSYTESFKAFKTCNQVFDGYKHKEVTGSNILRSVYENGINFYWHLYVFGLN